MDIREAGPADRPAIRDVARRSLQTSYSLGPKAIIGAVEEWYDENRLKDTLNDDDKLLLVAVVDGQVVAFSDSAITGDGTGELLWLHVDPDYRSEDIGQALFEGTRDRLSAAGAETIHGRVLADNAGGNAFYERQGLTKVGEEEVEVDGTPYTENVYAEVREDVFQAVTVEDDRTVYVDRETSETGSIGPFHVVYSDDSADDIYGYWCGKCDEMANAMDSMGRIQCDECGNTRKPSRWDAAYL